MYDSDDIHYVEVEHNDKKYVFNEIDRPLTEHEILKRLGNDTEKIGNKIKIDLAIAALNKYDYELTDKSAQSALWLINEMKDIFEGN